MTHGRFRIVALARGLRRVWCLTGVTLAALLLLELACRLLAGGPAREQAAFHRSPGLQETSWFPAYLEEAERFNVTWHPYVYWRLAPLTGRCINVDARGIRKTWRPPPPKEGREATRRIYMFGGSTLWGTYARDAFTIPSLVARILYEEHGIRAEITNFGESGYVSTQEVIALLLALRSGPPPDAVVFYDGVNDLFSAFQNGRAGLPQQEWHRRWEFKLLDDLGGLAKVFLGVFERSALNRVILKRRVWDRIPPHGPPIAPEVLAREAMEIYLGNLRIVRALGVRLGFSPLFYWQPVVFSRKNPTPYERNEARKMAAVAPCYRAGYRMAKTLPDLARIPEFHDLSGILDGGGKTLYVDFCHTTEEGGARVARRMAEDLAKLLGEG